MSSDHSLYKSSKTILLAGAALIVVLSGLYFYLQVREDHQASVEDIRRQVYQQLKGELQDVVKQQVKAEIETYLAQRPDVEKTLLLSSAEPEESLQDMVHVAVKDIFNERRKIQAAQPHPQAVYLTDAQLAQYVAAGGVETEISVGQGTKGVSSGEAGSSLAGTVAGSQTQQQPLERALEQRGSILLSKGTWQVEPSFTWAHFSSNQVTVNGITILDVFTIGQIFTDKIKRDILIQTMSFKYGLLNNLQLEMKVPSRYQNERRATISGNGVVSETTRNKAGLGDVEFGVSRQVAWEHGAIPDLVANLTLRTPTGEEPYNNTVALGTGHWAVRSSLIAAKASDPMVFFGSASYTANLPRTGIANYGDIDPGDSIGWSAGTALALSYKAALNFSFDHTVTMETLRNDAAVAGSFVNAANFKTGISWAIDDNKSMDFSVSMGLTNDAPDVSVDVRFPMKF